MAVFEFELRDDPDDLSIYTIAKSITGKSTMALRKRVADGIALVNWDTDNFPLTTGRKDDYEKIRTSIASLTSCDCNYVLLYRCHPTDPAEIVSYEQMCNLLESDLEYHEQTRD